LTDCSQKEDHVVRLRIIRGIFPVDVKAIKAQIRQDLYRTACKLGPAICGRGWLSKVGRVRPPTYRQEHLQVAVALLLEKQLFGAPIDVGTNIVPRVVRVVLVSIGPGIRQENFASIANIRKGVENMGELFSGKILWIVVATINSLQALSERSSPQLR